MRPIFVVAPTFTVANFLFVPNDQTLTLSNIIINGYAGGGPLNGPIEPHETPWTGTVMMVDLDTGGALYTSPPCSFSTAWYNGGDTFGPFGGSIPSSPSGYNNIVFAWSGATDDIRGFSLGAIGVFMDILETPGF
jgi:hypothetical protein